MEKLAGLATREAAESLLKWGPNEITDPNRTGPGKIILRQLKNNFMIYLLALAAVTSFGIGEALTGETIIGVIVMVIGISFLQEYRAEKAVTALKELITPVSTVIRGSKEQEIKTRDIVPGDIVVLRTGEKVPADCLLLRQSDVRLNESLLSGEANPVEKTLAGRGQPTSESSLIFAGTYVVSGKCLGKVLHTGMNTKFGSIVNLVSQTEKDLPLLVKVNKIARFMVGAAVAVSVATGLILLMQADTVTTKTISNALLVAIALAVSAFPEGLPVVLVTALAVGATRMARQNAIISRLSVIETLGETTVICSDKTGTITSGEMTAKKIWLAGKFIDVSGAGFEGSGQFLSGTKNISPEKFLPLKKLLLAGLIANDARIEKMGSDDFYKTFGSPSEAALLILAAKASLFRDDLKFAVKEEIPFSSERKMMSVLASLDGHLTVFAKGAPEIILDKCRLNTSEKKRVLAAARSLTRATYHVMALATKDHRGENSYSEDNLEFLGLVGFFDPPRTEIAAAIEDCRQAGIKVKIVTGDNQETALAVASQVGLSGKIMSGEALDKLTDDELRKTLPNYTLFVRVRPEHKLRIVTILKSLGEVVIMTGDGVNDAPALKDAQIGVAMGKSGTDVSRSVADLVLRDNNFATIVAAIKEGRTTFNNMRKFVSYQLSCNLAELMIIFLGVILSPILGWQAPILLALQILFMNLVTDDLPAITFAFNPTSKDMMAEPPRKNPDLVNRRLLSVAFLAGAAMTFFTIFSYFLSLNVLGLATDTARTIALLTLILLEIVNAFNFRSFRYLTLTRSPFVNKYLFAASALSLLLTLFVIYTPVNKAFETVPLPASHWLLPLTLALVFIFLFDLLKAINRRYEFVSLA